MLAQEARQRSGRHGLQETRAALLWQAVQVPEKIWEGLLPASRFCARTGIAARQPIRSVTVAKLSARLNILIVLQMRNWLPSVPNPARVAAVTF